jgi:hypothetical protein
MSNEFDTINRQINFLNEHVGGDLNDSIETFQSQKKIIEQTNTDYINLLDNEQKINRNKNSSDKNSSNTKSSDEYTKTESNKYYSADTRINNQPNYVNNADYNFSNPIIYPKDYDPYFEYIFNKNLNSINTQIVQTKTYINIDSSNRIINPLMSVDKYYRLQKNGLLFEDGTNYFRIQFTNANNYFEVGDKITIQGYKFYEIKYKSINFFFTNNSNKVILDIQPNFSTTIPYYNVSIELSGVNDNGLNYYKNIPLTIINQIHQVELYNQSNNDNKLIFEIPMTFYTDNILDNTLISDCTITYYYIGNYPINYINAGYPTTFYNLIGYQHIIGIDSEYITIKLTNILSLNNLTNLEGTWSDGIFSTGGENVQIGKIINITEGNPNPSNYVMVLDKRIDNIACIKMKSSEIPNTEKIFKKVTIYNVNNKLYWQNAIDNNQTYSIELPSGNYNLESLKLTLEELISLVPRNIIIGDNIAKTIYPFNIITVNFNVNAGIIIFKSYNKFILPNCLYSVNNDLLNNSYIIRINQVGHNLRVGNKIVINGSLNYDYIYAHSINNPNGHYVTKIISNDFYEITLKNINIITDPSVPTTEHGGNAINIITDNPFKLLFNYSDTMGVELGFKYVGTPIAITPFSNFHNDYKITNTQPYAYDIESIQIVNNAINNTESYNDINLAGYRYILLKSTNLNLCSNPNGVNYFYKILLNQSPGNILFNSYVDNPIYFNPPLRYLSQLSFQFVNPDGTEFNFYNINHSFTLEITSMNNLPENTNLSTGIARI